ncbi:AF4/FMR2 family member 1 isoform X1 [Tachyglossus aculeatus]|uniref:AF4/FMR2 family member 1 isoform X1 n=1 Tax=Tachyglossus aculeatus TaxID=9261 RepID=UPI0018F3698A|nr:AF4/FMR2 family member 1 isoform X1 [Tachyglossus aculeatus]
MAFTKRASSGHSSLYNEDRNLLRIRERERRNQEVHQETEAFPEKIPLFGEPYKTNKGDELSSKIQNMLGNYEEVTELISTKSHKNFLGIPVSNAMPPPQGKPNRPFHSAPAPQLVGQAVPAPMNLHPKAQPKMEPSPGPHAKSLGPPGGQPQGPGRGAQAGHGASRPKKSERRAEGDVAVEPPAPTLGLSPLLSTLSSPVGPLSPLHSNQHGSSMPAGSKGLSKAFGPATQSPRASAPSSHEEEAARAGGALTMAPPPPPSQTFPPPPLPSKTSAVQQKPTAYVRPMDGQDQAPSESPELKPRPDDLHSLPFDKITDLKVTAKAKLSKLKIPSEPIEHTFTNEVHCVEEILKEMTHSWPPPLTAIHTPGTAEPSKFPFPTKESQHIVIQNQKLYDAASKTYSKSQQGSSMLEDDLQLSDSEDSDDDQASEKPPPSPAPPSAPQSLPDSVASAHSSSADSESTSDSDSSSDSESESSSSDSEGNEPPEGPGPEPDPPTANKWQLDNWLTKVSQPAVPTKSPEKAGPRHRPPEGRGKSGGGAGGHERAETQEPPPKGPSSKGPKPPTEGHPQGKSRGQRSPGPPGPEEPRRQTVGTKQPKKPLKSPPREDSWGVLLQVESEPGPQPRTKEPPSRNKPRVKTKGRTRPGHGKEEARAGEPQGPGDRKKHKSAHPASAPTSAPASAPSQAGVDPEPVRDRVDNGSLECCPISPLNQGGDRAQGTGRTGSGRTSGTRPAEGAQDHPSKDGKFPLPFRDPKRLSPLRDTPLPQSLMVKINLALLSRVPQPPTKGTQHKRLEGKPLPVGRKEELDKRSTETLDKVAKKRKGEPERDFDSKKIKLEKDAKLLPSSSASKDASKTKMSRSSSEAPKKQPLAPAPGPPSPKPAKTGHKRPKAEGSASSQGPPKSTSTTKNSQKESSSSSKHRKTEGKNSGHSTSNKGSAGDIANPFPVPSLPNGNSKPAKPQVKCEKQSEAEFHMKEAKRLKHKADSMSDKIGKAFKYLDAVLAFIECGIAMESETPTPKSGYTMFAETVDFVKFIMSLKTFTDSSTSTQEKMFVVLCMRCQAILYMAMFRYKKDTAIKYSRTLNEHFKNSSRVALAPSPCVARSTGTPSPHSPLPSHASSASSCQPGSNANGGGAAGTVSTPVLIQTMTSSYVTITSYFLNAYELWEQADALARKNKEFFAELSTAACSLTMNSSLTELVHYMKQGLQSLRLATKMP